MGAKMKTGEVAVRNSMTLANEKAKVQNYLMRSSAF